MLSFLVLSGASDIIRAISPSSDMERWSIILYSSGVMSCLMLSPFDLWFSRSTSSGLSQLPGPGKKIAG